MDTNARRETTSKMTSKAHNKLCIMNGRMVLILPGTALFLKGSHTLPINKGGSCNNGNPDNFEEKPEIILGTALRQFYSPSILLSFKIYVFIRV